MGTESHFHRYSVGEVASTLNVKQNCQANLVENLDLSIIKIRSYKITHNLEF